MLPPPPSSCRLQKWRRRLENARQERITVIAACCFPLLFGLTPFAAQRQVLLLLRPQTLLAVHGADESLGFRSQPLCGGFYEPFNVGMGHGADVLADALALLQEVRIG